jgi:hypothetical protein
MKVTEKQPGPTEAIKSSVCFLRIRKETKSSISWGTVAGSHSTICKARNAEHQTVDICIHSVPNTFTGVFILQFHGAVSRTPN